MKKTSKKQVRIEIQLPLVLSTGVLSARLETSNCNVAYARQGKSLVRIGTSCGKDELSDNDGLLTLESLRAYSGEQLQTLDTT